MPALSAGQIVNSAGTACLHGNLPRAQRIVRPGRRVVAKRSFSLRLLALRVAALKQVQPLPAPPRD